MLPSLRSRLILASLLWTAGLLLLMHIFSMLVVHVFPGARGMSQPVLPIAAGLGIMASGLYAGRRSLGPFHELRERLFAVRRGEARQVAGNYPTEVQPLVDELNALLLEREKAIQRALAAAGDLAHGLKTPIAVLAQEADRARAEGRGVCSDSVVQQVERMHRQVNYQLARARAAASSASSAARCPVASGVEALIRTLAKLYAGRSLTFSSSVPPDLTFRVQQQDFDEILGNVLENSCKWAASQVRVIASAEASVVVLSIDDDGPGLPEDQREVVLERGVRLDQAAPGSGLGLAIVRDLVELYGGTVILESSPLGGLRVRLTLPAPAC